ncbi:MAG: bacteriophage abortive infection AbiH family protein [Defluviitaleaceae bacterium]|nr:bacteriophage abortive infection AbiH family protein [Defluviitaleaceae bacterium]
MPSSQTLLIIGNGFDLQRGLKSHYKDFFAWLRDFKYPQRKDNLWEIHFLHSTFEGDGWVDIEAKIQEILINNKFSEWKSDVAYNKILIPETRYIHKVTKNSTGHIDLFDLQIKLNNLDYKWLLYELKVFENSFCEYIKEQVEGNGNHLSNAIDLLGVIAERDAVQIINFNYTNPFNHLSLRDSSRRERLKKLVCSYHNVHGTYINKDIIFGVDATAELSRNSGTRIFNKTYRKMFLKDNARVLPETVNKIKFYGHSLGEADYSYFQSIFDSYNLYGEHKHGQVTLQFYFTNGIETMEEAADRVHKLITAYGDTLDNKDKGKNLLHKLLLEGRLQIKFIDGINV